MKSKIILVILSGVIALCFALVWMPSNMDAAFIVPGQTATITFSQVPVQVDFPFQCDMSAGVKQMCAAFGELVQLNNPDVDAVLTKYKVIVKDSFGKVIFPRIN